MNKEQIWNIVLIISIILVIQGLTKTGSPDKKEAQVGQGQTALGTIGVASSFFGRKMVVPAVVPGFVWVWGVFLAVASMVPNLITGIFGIFKPQPSIPMWVWVVGFALLAFMVLRKK